MNIQKTGSTESLNYHTNFNTRGMRELVTVSVQYFVSHEVINSVPKKYFAIESAISLYNNAFVSGKLSVIFNSIVLLLRFVNMVVNYQSTTIYYNFIPLNIMKKQ